MRVAVVAMLTSHVRDREGVRRVEGVAERLAARGHDVTVFCSGWWTGYDEERVEDGVAYRAVTVSPARTSFLARVPALLAAWRPDVVHATPAPPRAVQSAKLGARLARAPLVVDWYGDEARDFADAGGWKRAATAPDRVVTPSRLVATRVRERGASEGDVQVIPESVDMDLVRGTEPADDAPDLVAARRLDEHANLDDFLLALAELRQRDWRATVFGDGPRREAFEREASDLRIDDRVTFAGEAAREERVAAYRGAHVFVQTATREYFATELLWALACGCVGIVEYQEDASAHELVERRPRGFRVTDPAEIEDAIEEAGDLAQWTVDDDFDEFDHDAVLDRYLDCYRDLGAGG